MIDNIGPFALCLWLLDKIIDRGEKLDIIVDKTDALADTADVVTPHKDSSVVVPLGCAEAEVRDVEAEV